MHISRIYQITLVTLLFVSSRVTGDPIGPINVKLTVDSDSEFFKKNDKMIYITLDEDTKIWEIKLKILKQKGIPLCYCSHFSVDVTYSDGEPEDDRPLSSYRYPSGPIPWTTLVLNFHISSIPFKPKKLTIIIGPEKDRNFLFIDCVLEDTIHNVKVKIQEQKNIPVAWQCLGHRRYETMDDHMEDDKTLAYNNIQLEDSPLYLYLNEYPSKPGTITITYQDKYFFILYHRDDTIQNVKAKIQEQTGIPTEHQRLVFPGKELEDDDRTLSEEEIPEDYCLHLMDIRTEVDTEQ